MPVLGSTSKQVLTGLEKASIQGASMDGCSTSAHDAEDAINVLCDLLGPLGKQADDIARPYSALSMLSTRAGSTTPGVDGMSTPCRCISPMWSPPGTPFGVACSGSELQLNNSKSTNAGAIKVEATKAETSKVFVGGIPQHWDRNFICSTFSKFGKVKKAWLQTLRHDRTMTSKPLNHRGFGFVVFSEKNAVDNVLGDSFARIVWFGDTQVEVKRAVSTREIALQDVQGIENGQRKGKKSNMHLGSDLPSAPIRSHQPCATQWLDRNMPAAPCFPRRQRLMNSELPPALFQSNQSLENVWLNNGLPALPSYPQMPPSSSPRDGDEFWQIVPHALPYSSNDSAAFLQEFTQDVFPGFVLEKTPGSGEELERLLLNAAPESYDE